MTKKHLKLRPEVEKFAQLMERELRKNDHKGKRGWRTAIPQQLLARLCEETAELIGAFSADRTGEPFRGLVIAEHALDCAADILRTCAPTLTNDFKNIRPRQSIDEVQCEAVDVANFCMFIVDIIGALRR